MTFLLCWLHKKITWPNYLYLFPLFLWRLLSQGNPWVLDGPCKFTMRLSFGNNFDKYQVIHVFFSIRYLLQSCQRTITCFNRNGLRTIGFTTLIKKKTEFVVIYKYLSKDINIVNMGGSALASHTNGKMHKDRAPSWSKLI